MQDVKLGVVETRFAEIVWVNEPISSRALAQKCAAELGWKRTTMYTVLKKLCERGIFENDGGTVRALIPREKFIAMQSEQFVEQTFDGSLPAFIAAFTAHKQLSEEEIAQIQRMIDDIRKEK